MNTEKVDNHKNKVAMNEYVIVQKYACIELYGMLFLYTELQRIIISLRII